MPSTRTIEIPTGAPPIEAPNATTTATTTTTTATNSNNDHDNENAHNNDDTASSSSAHRPSVRSQLRHARQVSRYFAGPVLVALCLVIPTIATILVLIGVCFLPALLLVCLTCCLHAIAPETTSTFLLLVGAGRTNSNAPWDWTTADDLNFPAPVPMPRSRTDVEQLLTVQTVVADDDSNDDNDTCIALSAIPAPCCDICITDYQVGDRVSKSRNAECDHVFHLDCILDWMQKKPTCPCCRRNYLGAPETPEYDDLWGRTFLHAPPPPPSHPHARLGPPDDGPPDYDDLWRRTLHPHPHPRLGRPDDDWSFQFSDRFLDRNDEELISRFRWGRPTISASGGGLRELPTVRHSDNDNSDDDYNDNAGELQGGIHVEMHDVLTITGRSTVGEARTEGQRQGVMTEDVTIDAAITTGTDSEGEHHVAIESVSVESTDTMTTANDNDNDDDNDDNTAARTTETTPSECEPIESASLRETSPSPPPHATVVVTLVEG